MDNLTHACDIFVRGHLRLVPGHLPIVRGHFLRFVANAT